jgi:hypothetical protein
MFDYFLVLNNAVLCQRRDYSDIRLLLLLLLLLVVVVVVVLLST